MPRSLAARILTIALLLSIPALAFLPDSGSESWEVPLPAYDDHGHDSWQALQGADRAESSLEASLGGNWRLWSWNARSKTPHYLYSSGADSQGAIRSAEEAERTARRLIDQLPGVFSADNGNLRLKSTPQVRSKWAAHFQQTWEGLEVWGGGVSLVFHENGRPMLLGSDYYQDINLSSYPLVSSQEAELLAKASLPFNPASDRLDGESVLAVLPYPVSENRVEYHLAWRVRVRTAEPLGIWVSWIDAEDGEILWRWNDIHFNYSGTAVAEVQPYTWCNGIEDQSLRYLRLTVDGVGNTIIDAEGNWSIDGSGGMRQVTGTFFGPYCQVSNQGGPDGEYAGLVNEGIPLNIRFDDAVAQHDERDVFDGVSDVHDFFQLFAPEFGLPNQRMNAYVSENNSCNAYWDGGIHFYREGGNCANTGEIQGVVYHEFGHGVQHEILGGQGQQGLGEGNSDILACLITQESICARGFYLDDCVNGIRDADNNLVYPDDVVGEGIHYAGQVIAGFHWDMMLGLQDQYGEEAGTLESAEIWHYGRILTEPNTQPDQVLSAFLIDDDDGALGNGTPHFAQISAAALNHGFEVPELIYGVLFEHTPIDNTDDTENPYPVLAEVTSTEGNILEGSVEIYWRASGGAWSASGMSHVAGDTYEGAIPPQAGAQIDYYLTAEDDAGNAGSEPQSAPYSYFTFNVTWLTDTMEEESGWTVGAADDYASGGIWVRVDPVGTIAQPEDDHTQEGTLCWVTGQHVPGEADDFSDVDGGRTTLFSPVYDLTGAENVLIQYWRWFSNDQGSAPGFDYWKVYATGDAGGWWHLAERTHISSNAWQQVSYDPMVEFPEPTLFQMRFVASDSAQPSLIEAAVDDFAIVAFFNYTGAGDNLDVQALPALKQNYPNPFNPRTEIRFQLQEAGEVDLRIFDAAGRLVKNLARGHHEIGEHVLVWDGRDSGGMALSSGVYFLKLQSPAGEESKRMVLLK